DAPARPVERAPDRLCVDLSAKGDLRAGLLSAFGLELRWHLRGQPGDDRPVLFRLESPDLPLAVHDHAEGDGLHPSGRKPPAHLLPQQRADLVADQPVEDAPGLLCVHLPAVDLPGVPHRRKDRLLRDLVELHPVELLPRSAQLLLEMPADRFPFTIGVGCKVDRGYLLRRLSQLREGLLLRGEDGIGGMEGLLVHAKTIFGKVPDMAHRGLYDVVFPQELVDSLRLSRRLDDDERLLGCRHPSPFLRVHRANLAGSIALSARRVSFIMHHPCRVKQMAWGTTGTTLKAEGDTDPQAKT